MTHIWTPPTEQELFLRRPQLRALAAAPLDGAESNPQRQAERDSWLELQRSHALKRISLWLRDAEAKLDRITSIPDAFAEMVRILEGELAESAPDAEARHQWRRLMALEQEGFAQAVTALEARRRAEERLGILDNVTSQHLDALKTGNLAQEVVASFLDVVRTLLPEEEIPKEAVTKRAVIPDFLRASLEVLLPERAEEAALLLQSSPFITWLPEPERATSLHLCEAAIRFQAAGREAGERAIPWDQGAAAFAEIANGFFWPFNSQYLPASQTLMDAFPAESDAAEEWITGQFQDREGMAILAATPWPEQAQRLAEAGFPAKRAELLLTDWRRRYAEDPGRLLLELYPEFRIGWEQWKRAPDNASRLSDCLLKGYYLRQSIEAGPDRLIDLLNTQNIGLTDTRWLLPREAAEIFASHLLGLPGGAAVTAFLRQFTGGAEPQSLRYLLAWQWMRVLDGYPCGLPGGMPALFHLAHTQGAGLRAARLWEELIHPAADLSYSSDRLDVLHGLAMQIPMLQSHNARRQSVLRVALQRLDVRTLEEALQSACEDLLIDTQSDFIPNARFSLQP